MPESLALCLEWSLRPPGPDSLVGNRSSSHGDTIDQIGDENHFQVARKNEKIPLEGITPYKILETMHIS
jgi:hypothetical protein